MGLAFISPVLLPRRTASRTLSCVATTFTGVALRRVSTKYSVSHAPHWTSTATQPQSTKQTESNEQSDIPQQEVILQWYRKVPVEAAALRYWRETGNDNVKIEREDCFNVSLLATESNEGLKQGEKEVLEWLLAETFDKDGLARKTWFTQENDGNTIVEVGPRLNFQTAWSANAVGICKACGVDRVQRLERSRRYRISGDRDVANGITGFVECVRDRMTETIYKEPLQSFDLGIEPEETFEIPLKEKGIEALKSINQEMGLGFDEWDIQYYKDLFNKMGRNPTNVELFDLAQSNSEHSRHWFFKGKLVIDGVPIPEKHLLHIVRQTLDANPSNSVIAFADNSSTIRGGPVSTLIPTSFGGPSSFAVEDRDRDLLFTAETHNFPSGVAPFPGAETGTGGRIRDTAATGIGSLVIAGTAGYSVGALPNTVTPQLPQQEDLKYPNNLASPLKILLDASSGASDYGNKFGEPVINGFARTYAMLDSEGKRREYLKPIMFSGGIGQIEHEHSFKDEARPSLLVVKLGGPAYRIGCGGGAASSMVSGDNNPDLDFNAVQRGDAEMESKVYRVLRACVELGNKNPIVSIHDQGAGGNCNVVKELIFPAGAIINLRDIWVGDKTLSALEIWGAEYQEQFGMLIEPESKDLLWQLCARENVEPRMLGVVDGSGKITLYDKKTKRNIVDLNLEAVLGDLPQKTFKDERVKPALQPFHFPEDLSILGALNSVMRLMTVGSKRFLTTKVDRSVTGLVALQSTVGPLQIPLSDAAIVAQSHFTQKGGATGIGERPSLTEVSPAAMARMTVGEMITNLCCVKITKLENIKCEGNWMWAAKMPGEAATIYDAAVALRDAMITLGIAIDGGKDSLSMAARSPTSSGDFSTVKAPGTLVLTGYSIVDDITVKSTPDIKKKGGSVILHVDLADGQRRLGGSALAYSLGEIGEECPDADMGILRTAFEVTQEMIGKQILSYHDVSDGGILVSLLEMGFAGNCGLNVFLRSGELECSVEQGLFAEELGMLIEVSEMNQYQVVEKYREADVPCQVIATTRADSVVKVSNFATKDSDDNDTIFRSDIRTLRDTWEATSFALDALQANPACVEAEKSGLSLRKGLSYFVPYTPVATAQSVSRKHKVAIVREEGSNGDREMAAAFHLAGFETWDVQMKDISSGAVSLNTFRGVAFVGGFSYADVLDSAKGWGGVIKYKRQIQAEFAKFFNRTDTFSLGVCNGCQLMALLGVIPFAKLEGSQQPRFIHNESERFESRFLNIEIFSSPSIMLKNMQGSKLGVWCSHGEGRAHFPEESILDRVRKQRLAPVRYVDDDEQPTTQYPFNPNGSAEGIAALCSPDGRHLGMMPHPERTVLKWQWAYLPKEHDKEWEVSPWLTMFQNARKWCDEHAAT